MSVVKRFQQHAAHVVVSSVVKSPKFLTTCRYTLSIVFYNVCLARCGCLLNNVKSLQQLTLRVVKFYQQHALLCCSVSLTTSTRHVVFKKKKFEVTKDQVHSIFMNFNTSIHWTLYHSLYACIYSTRSNYTWNKSFDLS